jgi:acetyl esterase
MPIDPRVKRFLDRLAAVNPPSALSLTAAQRRTALRELMSFSGQPEEVARTEETTLPGPEGRMRMRIYTPAGATGAELPALVYFHGGGLVAGDLDTHDPISRALANASGCRLFAIDYRLAPEHRFPAAIADGCAATTWIAAHAAQLGVDPRRVAVGGDSAGATLATVVCRIVIAEQRVPVSMQFLLCPITDFGTESESRRRYAEGYLVDRATLEHDLRHYLGGDADLTDPRISPLRAPDLHRLPPTCIHTAEFDPLCDEGKAYADRIESAGVRTLYRCHSGMIHLFYGLGALIPYAAKAYSLMGADIRSLLE